MNKKKKKILIVLLFIIGFAVLAVAVLALGSLLGTPISSDDGGTAIYDNEIKVLNDNYPSDIIVFGEDVGFNSKLKFRTITEITEENLTSDSQYKYSFFVINDREGKLNISDEEFELCKKMCDENNLNFFYIGEHYLARLKNFGFYDGLYADNLLGIGYVITPTGHAAIQGFWTTEEEEHYHNNPDLLGQLLALSFVNDVIKMLN